MTQGVDSALQAYGAGLGLPDLAFGPGGEAALRMESGRTLTVARGDGQTLVYLSEPAGYEAGELMLKAAKQAHRTRLGAWPVQVALRQAGDEERLLVLLRLDEAEATPLRLEQAVEFLARWLDDVRAQ